MSKLDLDRIEGLAGRLRELSDDASLFNIPAVNALVTRSREAASDLTALISYARELEGALEPFAAEADRIDPNGPDPTVGDSCEVWQIGGYPINQSKITYGQLRRARAALSRTQK